MGNSEIIDSVVDPIAIAQFNQLKTASAEAAEQMIIATKAALALNNATGGSQSFSVFKKNLDLSNNALNAIITNTEKARRAEDKARQYKADMDEKALNKYLTLMSKQQAAREEQDAKDIAAAEKKAAKLQVIQAEAARKAAVQFQTPDPNNPYGLVNPSITQEPAPVVIPEDISPITAKNTEAVAVENAALLEQQQALAMLSVEQKQNIELLLSLQAERAANTVELKTLNTETAVGSERAIFLTAEQIRLKQEIAGVTLELNRQAKQMIAAQGSVTELDQSILLLSSAYESLSVAERESAQGQKMGAELAALRTQQNELALSVKNTKNNIGNYTESIDKSAKGMQLADRISNQFTRSIIRMGVQFLLIGVAFKAIEWLYDYIKALDIFNPVATEAERVQKGLSEAFASADYSKAIEGIEKLASNLDLVKTGAIDSDTAINQYNETIGKTFGFVNNLNDAQQGFIDHKDDYIKAILQEATANAILADSAKELADLGKKQQDLRNKESDVKNGKATFESIFDESSTNDKLQKEDLIKGYDKKIADLEKRRQDVIKNTIGALDETGKTTSNKGIEGTDPAAELRNKIENEALEHQKIIAQKTLSDDKESYAARIKAANDFYDASKKQLDNDAYLKLRVLPANDARIEDVEKDFANKSLQNEQARTSKLQELRDKAYKQDQEHLKANIQAQKDSFKQISEDPNQSYDMKLIALDVYNKKSLELIKLNYNEQVKEAGKNTKSITSAEDNKKKAIIQLETETAEKRLKIVKENLAKIIETSKETEQEQLDILDRGAKQALQAMANNRDNKEDALSLQRAKGLISEKEYTKKLLAINDQYAIDKIALEIQTQRTILAIEEGQRDVKLSLAKLDGATPEQLAKMAAESNKAIQKTQDAITAGEIALGHAKSKQKIDQTETPDAKNPKQAEIFALEQTMKAVDELDKLRQQAYENEITRLEKLSQQIDDNATAEKNAVEHSILSSADKQRKESLIDAQAAAQKKNIQAEEAKIKQKEAIADKEAAIAKIILNTAIAAIKLPADGGFLGLAAVPIVLALGAVELAAAAATPIPKFWKGTKNSPEGFAHVGERGTELMIDPSGKMSLTPNTDTITYLQKGTQIVPNHMIRPEKLNYSSGQQVPWKEVIDAIKKSKAEPQKRPVNRINVNVDGYYQKFYR